VVLLRHRVGYNDLVQRTRVDAIDGVSAQNAVGDQCNHLRRTLLFKQFGRAGDRVGRVGQIVDEDGSALGYIADKHHGRILAVIDLRGAALFMDKGKGHAERVGDGGGAFGAAGVGADDDGLLVVEDAELDVFAQEVAAVEIVDGDVEEALVLGVWGIVSSVSCPTLQRPRHLRTVEIHGNDMVCASAREQVCNQRAGLSDPLPIADLRFKGRWS